MKSVPFLVDHNSNHNYYAVVDINNYPEIQVVLKKTEHAPLYSEQNVLKDVGNPCLIKLNDSVMFLFEEKLVRNKLKNSGIIAECGQHVSFDSVATHFKSLTRVRNHRGELFLFRFYDSEIFKIFLPLCTKEQVEDLWGPVQAYYLVDKSGNLLRFKRTATT